MQKPFPRAAGILLLFLSILTLSLSATEDPPIIERIDPPQGGVPGGSITIQGIDFLTEDGQTAYALLTDENQLTLSAPAYGHNESLQLELPDELAPGKIQVILMRKSMDGKVERTRPFPYAILAPPQITSVRPAQGPAGTEVTLRGKRLGQRQNNSYVVFVGEMKNEFRGSARAMVASWNDDEIQAIVPYEMAPGPTEVRVVRMDPNSNKGILTDATNEETRFLVLPPH